MVTHGNDSTVKVLALHAEYRIPGGEEKSFAQDVALLHHLGCEVEQYTVSNRDFKFTNALRGEFISNRDIRQRVAEAQPNMIYLNNLWPSIGAGVASAAAGQGIAVLQAIRNYRLVCVAADLRLNGEPCQKCVQQQSLAPGILNRCFRGSLPLSLAVAASSLHNQKLIRRHPENWLLSATSATVRDRLVASGIPEASIRVRDNFLFESPEYSLQSGAGAVFLGRLEPEKGIGWLLDLWKANQALPNLTVAGSGSMVSAVQLATSRDRRIKFVGQLGAQGALTLMRSSAVVLVPSLWDEPFGRTAMEGMAVGTPVLVSDKGALPAVVGDDFRSLSTADEDGWVSAILWLSSEAAQLAERPKVLEMFRAKYSRQRAAEEMMRVLSVLGVAG